MEFCSCFQIFHKLKMNKIGSLIVIDSFTDLDIFFHRKYKSVAVEVMG